MSVDVKASGGSDSSSGGTSETKDTENPSAGNSVSYESHQKLLKEKKSLAERLAAFEAEAKKREESELTAKQEYKKLYESQKSQTDEWKGKYENLDGTVAESVKLRAFLDKAPGKIEKQYWGLIDLSNIPMDPETREPDEAAVEKAVKDFEKKYARVIEKSNGATLPDDAAMGTGGKLVGFKAELKAAKTQAELDAVMKKYGKV